MPIRAEHELHARRWSRNRGLALALLAFVTIIFGLSVAKMSRQGPVQGFDHVVRPELSDSSR